MSQIRYREDMEATVAVTGGAPTQELQATTQFILNGQSVEVGEHPHLLAALREELGVTSAKDGCSPSGQCGCCTVLVDGKAMASCLMSLAKIAGKSITTLEGFERAERERFASAFAATGALQCGFCTPGIVVRMKALIDKKGSALTREEAARHLGAHLCRCTGYAKILDAVELLASGESAEVVLPTGIGSRGVRYQGTDLALGDRGYVDDISVPGMLHGALRLSDHARAEVLRIDTAAAEAVAGVQAVFTAKDVPGALRVGIIYEDWPIFIPEGGRTSYLGDVLAIVVADSKQVARDAAKLVEVTYNPLRPLTDPAAAIDDPEDAVWTLEGNVLSRSSYKRGDVDAALEASAHRVQETFETQRVEHAFLEPESTVAIPQPDGTLKVFSGGQGVWDDRNQIASILGVDNDRIVVEQVSNGGAFGGKEDMSNQGQTALAAWLLKQPVKCTLSREESLILHPKRHPIRMEYDAGCDDERPAHAPQGAHGRRLGSLRLGRHEGARAGRGPRLGPLRGAGDRRRVRRRADQQLGLRCLPWLWRQPGPVRHGGRHRPPGRRGRYRPVGDAVRNAVSPGVEWGPGQIMDDGCIWGKGVSGGDKARLRRRRRRTERRSGSVSGSRIPGSATGSWRSSRPLSASAMTGRSRSATAGPRWAKACTPSPARSPSRSSASTPRWCGSSSTPPVSSGRARRPVRVARS